MPIFCDLDGVLVDFVGGVSDLCGVGVVPRSPLSTSTYALEGIFGKYVWDDITAEGEKFWSHLKPLPWAQELWWALNQIGTVYILSSPGRESFSPCAAAGKMRWCEHHLRIGADRVILTHAKHVMSRHGNVLVDDSDAMCETWSAHGGSAYLFPQPWNDARSAILQDTDEIVAAAVAWIKKQHTP